MLVLRAGGGRQRLVGALSHHVRDALAVVAFLWLGGQATLLGVVIQTSTVITATEHGTRTDDRNIKITRHIMDKILIDKYSKVWLEKGQQISL